MRMLTGRIVAIALLASAPARAQRIEPTAVLRVSATASAMRLPAADSRGAFAYEALGGTVGSLVGIGLVAAVTSCGVEDLGCAIVQTGAAGLAGVVGATLGTSLVARETGSRASVGGAAVGAVVGTGVGLGVHWLLNHASDRNFDDVAAVVPIFVLSQGVLASLGSRAFASHP